MNSLWLVIVALSAFIVAYRFYGAFLATRVAMLDDRNTTPAHRLRDGVDYHPTSRLVLFGHHFAAIAGPGPLVGPVLASQWGYFPGFAWIIVGACLAGAVHDFVVLWASVRREGLSLPKIAHSTIGPLSGFATSLATLFIVISILASVAIVVVNTLAESSWGMFTIIVTIPAALLTGAWMYKIRPGRVAEASAIGVTIVLLGVILGKPFADSAFGHYLMFNPRALSYILPTYAFVASVLPVWVLMCPRDYLSCYMKVGVIFVLAAGILVAHPMLKMPATTPFLANGPVINGPVWPFVCIVIMCGAISGFHALVASGTTPKMIYRESDIRPIGYGAMVLEGFVAVMALIAACSLEPGDYFAINMDQSKPAKVAAYNQFIESTRTVQHWDLAPRELSTLESEMDENLRGRVGGAVTLAVGMAKVFSSVPGMKTLMAYWYHFVIMFEALFILTLLETGTRVARFVVQETAAYLNPALAPGGKTKWGANIALSALTCMAWGYLLLNNNINTLWRMLGISNQLLASIALAVGATYILIHSPRRVYALCAGVPLIFTLGTILTGSAMSIRQWWGQIAGMVDTNQILQLKLMCLLGTLMIMLTVVIVVDTVRRWWVILKSKPEAAPPQARLAREGAAAGR
ncbi:MAG: carbon starvation protein A [bacterium]|nr:carbon starvation protein A [bacterium]